MIWAFLVLSLQLKSPVRQQKKNQILIRIPSIHSSTFFYTFFYSKMLHQMPTVLDSSLPLQFFISPPPRLAITGPTRFCCSVPISSHATSMSHRNHPTIPSAVPRRNAMALILSSCIFAQVGPNDIAFAQRSVEFREYIDTFDGYSLKYPRNWIQVRGSGADIFFRDPFILDENISVEMSSPSSSKYNSVKDLGPPQEAAKKVLKQYLTEFMSTRLGVRRESTILSSSSKVADDGKLYYQVEVNIKSYANNNELAVMPQERVVRLEWDRRYLSVLGVENNQLYELRVQTPENVFLEEENDLREVMDSFRVNKVSV